MVLISHDLAANIFWCQGQSIYLATRTDLPIQAFTAGQLPGLILTRWKLLFFLHGLLNSVYRKSGDQPWYTFLSTSLFICLSVVNLWTADFYFRSLWNILMIQHVFVEKKVMTMCNIQELQLLLSYFLVISLLMLFCLWPANEFWAITFQPFRLFSWNFTVIKELFCSHSHDIMMHELLKLSMAMLMDNKSQKRLHNFIKSVR